MGTLAIRNGDPKGIHALLVVPKHAEQMRVLAFRILDRICEQLDILQGRKSTIVEGQNIEHVNFLMEMSSLRCLRSKSVDGATAY